ncbi:hypothetical protein SAY86_030931 [Trapa natans]|uniref:Protein BIG GRAIN 1-like A n=1 Tax=Trapa natans TaxID=22666 RepID=A0AAN7RE08_TRANT|nr:hypothetical protein SAY86_030931 [Trapa natans]
MYRAHSPSHRFTVGRQIPSFSSTLLDKIYRSIDESDSRLHEPMSCRQSKCGSMSSRIAQDPEIQGIIVRARACLERKTRVADDDFFSSNSSSSDSSSGGFSSSDTESMYGMKQRLSNFAQPPVPRPKPVRLEKQRRIEKKMEEERQRTLFQVFHRYPSMNEASTAAPFHSDESTVKSKSRALKIYANLKKVKQPISPGARLSSFINSLFTSGNSKKPKSSGGSGHVSACSSATSFSRSCLSKNRPDTRDGGKKTVRFDPVSVSVDKNQRSLHGPDRHRRAGRSPGRKPEKQTTEEDVRRNMAAVEVAKREFLRDYSRNQRPSYGAHEDDDDDVSSCSSSDLFELDHLVVAGNDRRHGEELPVYETTRVTRNLAIANGLKM